jgi:hypothetical protein
VRCCAQVTPIRHDYLTLKKSKRGFGVRLGIEGDIEAGLNQRQAKQFALAGAVFDQ